MASIGWQKEVYIASGSPEGASNVATSEILRSIAGVVMSKSSAVIFIASALWFQLAPLTRAEVILVKDGSVLATIVLAEQPRSAAQLAAHELQ